MDNHVRCILATDRADIGLQCTTAQTWKLSHLCVLVRFRGKGTPKMVYPDDHARTHTFSFTSHAHTSLNTCAHLCAHLCTHLCACARARTHTFEEFDSLGADVCGCVCAPIRSCKQDFLQKICSSQSRNQETSAMYESR